MAYDEDRAMRIRGLVQGNQAVSERPMFGGLAFLLHGNMAIAAASKGGLMVRIDPDQADDLTQAPGVEVMEMRGRPMRGWLLVDATGLDDDDELAHWFSIGMAYAGTLDPKRRQ